MLESMTQVKVFISCPSDVEKEKQLAERICDTLSTNIFNKRNIHIRAIHWAKDVPRTISGDGPQKTIDDYLSEEDYDIYIGILWRRFGEPQNSGLTPTEGEFEDALKRRRETERPLIKFYFKKEKYYPENEYDASQSLSIQKFKKSIESLGLHDDFISDFDFYEKTYASIHQLVDQLTSKEDDQIRFRRMQYNVVVDYIPRRIYPAEKYKPDEFWFLGDKYKEDLIEIIDAKNRIALIGDAGSGKTLELDRVASYFSQENTSFYPLLIRLNTYADQNIDNLLPEDWNNIPEKQWLIILDGLDEVESKNKNTAIRKIEHFSERYPSSSIIVSCRTNFYQTESNQNSGTLNGFESYRLLDLGFDEIESYIKNKVLAKSSRFLNEICKFHLDPLLQIPFYLVSLVEIFTKEDSLPEKRGNILQKLFMARMKLDEEHFRTTIDLGEKRAAILSKLERVALGMECLGRNYLFDDEYRELVTDSSSRDLLRHCTAWEQINRDGVQWQFEHNSIQEYLAASILSRQPLNVIKGFISFQPEYTKIIPSWVNAVSFLLSISGDSNLISWILEIEPEICLKFEADRIQKDTRIEIIKDIFNRYKEKRIGINRDRFRNDELARFGQSDEILEFLINEAKKASHQTILGNALEIISAMNIPPDFKDQTRDLLERVATNNCNIQISDSIQCTGLIALSRLKFDSKDVIDRVVSKLRSSKNDWIRYGLYCLLHESEFLDEFIDVFLEGINYVSMDASSLGSSRLMNERWELKQGLKKAEAPQALKKIIRYFIGEGRHLHDLFIGDHDISFISETAVKVYTDDPSILCLTVDFSLFMAEDHHKQEADQFFKFYIETDTRLDAFKIAMGKENQYREDFIADLADPTCIEYFVNKFDQGELSEDFVWRFLHALRQKNNEIFESFYSIINQKTNDKFILKPIPDWEKIRNERRERDVQLIFDKKGLLQEIELIFETEGKETLTAQELSKLRSKYGPDRYYSDFACDTLLDLTREKQPVSMEIAYKIFSERDWEWFQVTKIYERMQIGEELNLSQEQREYIATWCNARLDKVDFKNAIQKTDKNSFSIRWDAIYLWYFFRKLNLQYPNNILLDMLSFDYNRKGIEYLEDYLDESEMKSRILENLNTGIYIDNVLKNHIDYCRRHKVREVIKYALKEIGNQDREPSDEIRRISLEAVSQLSEDLHELELILSDIKDGFKWLVIDELIKHGNQKIQSFLKQLFNDGDKDEKLKASEYLIKYQDLDALRFYVDWMKEHKEISRQSYDSSPIRSLKTSEAIPLLIELLEMSYREGIQLTDPFERLDRLVLDSLTVIAFISNKNYLEVKKSIESFIEKYSGLYQDVNWLNAFLDQLEQQYYVNKSEKYDIKDVIEKLEGVTF